MFGVVLAVLVFAFFFVAHMAVSHLSAVKNKEPVLVRFMVACGLSYLVLFALSLRWSTRLSASSPTTDLVTGLAALGFLVLGYIEFWSLIERSFSLRILIDTAGAPAGLTRAEIAKSYSSGRGLDWMMEKRVEDLVGAGMLMGQTPDPRLTRRGGIVARAFQALQRIFVAA